MKPKAYAILARAVEEGVKRGYSRAFKHVENPEQHVIEDAVIDAVMGEICDVFTFDEDES